jgi:hypothetical protein
MTSRTRACTARPPAPVDLYAVEREAMLPLPFSGALRLIHLAALS